MSSESPSLTDFFSCAVHILQSVNRRAFGRGSPGARRVCSGVTMAAQCTPRRPARAIDPAARPAPRDCSRMQTDFAGQTTDAGTSATPDQGSPASESTPTARLPSETFVRTESVTQQLPRRPGNDPIHPFGGSCAWMPFAFRQTPELQATAFGNQQPPEAGCRQRFGLAAPLAISVNDRVPHSCRSPTPACGQVLSARFAS